MKLPNLTSLLLAVVVHSVVAVSNAADPLFNDLELTRLNLELQRLQWLRPRLFQKASLYFHARRKQDLVVCVKYSGGPVQVLFLIWLDVGIATEEVQKEAAVLRRDVIDKVGTLLDY